MRRLMLLPALALVLLAPADASARSARECEPPDYPGRGYFTSLTVRHTTCAAGRKLALAYYRCRTEHGRAGRCNRRVRDYACTETRNTIPTEINARVRCKRGTKRIVHTYQQDL